MQIAVTIMISLIVTFGITSCSSLNTEWIIVSNAKLTDEAVHKIMSNDLHHQIAGLENSIVVTGHRISEGDGIVIAYRGYDSGPLLLTDKAKFRKMTIYIPSDTVQKHHVVKIPSEGVIGFWSNGSSNFPGMTGCLGYASDGTVLFQASSKDEVSAKIEIGFDLISPRGWKNDCTFLMIKQQVILKKKTVSDLTAWEGIIGKHIYDETMMK